MAGGRPQAATETRRDSRLAVRLTAGERAALDARAAAVGLPLAEYVRAVLVDAEPPRRRQAPSGRPRLTADEFRELNAVGVNLNQLAKRANAGDQRELAAPVMAALDRLQTIFERFLQ